MQSQCNDVVTDIQENASDTALQCVASPLYIRRETFIFGRVHFHPLHCTCRRFFGTPWATDAIAHG